MSGVVRRPSTACAAAAIAALVVLAAASAPASALEVPASPAPDGVLGSPDELAGWRAIDEQKWVRARELGEKVLRERPDAFAGHHVLGVALHYGEGDLARSVFHLEEAVKRFEERYGRKPAPDTPWRWHEAALRELAYSLNEMDRAAEELDVLDRYDAAYLPKRVAQRVWPLMKLKRYREAREAARLAIASGNHEQRVIARSDLCAAECEAGDREKAYQACMAATADYRDGAFGGQVEFSNASEAALSVYKFDEAEKLLAESTRRAVPDSWGNPYQHLAQLYLTEGRIPEAIEALKGGQELRLARPAWLDQHGQSRLDQTVASLLLVVGQTERALQIAERASARPDRQGVHSGTEDQATVAAAVLLSIALREAAAREEEDAVTSGVWAAVKLRASAAAHRVAAWREARRAAVILADPDFLVRTLRPYYVGGADLPMWTIADVVDIVGGGVGRAAIARARAADTFGAAPAYFDAYQAEAAFARRDCDEARAAAERALGRLPHAETLLAGRMAAVSAECARREGDTQKATERFATALVKDPGVLRRLDLALPVTVETDGSEVAALAAKLVGKSPRFRVGDVGHVVSLSATEACLFGPSHEVLQCATPKADQGRSRTDEARALVAELHRVAFAFKSDLSQADLTSLDGSPTAARAERQVKSLLDQLK